MLLLLNLKGSSQGWMTVFFSKPSIRFFFWNRQYGFFFQTVKTVFFFKPSIRFFFSNRQYGFFFQTVNTVLNRIYGFVDGFYYIYFLKIQFFKNQFWYRYASLKIVTQWTTPWRFNMYKQRSVSDSHKSRIVYHCGSWSPQVVTGEFHLRALWWIFVLTDSSHFNHCWRYTFVHTKAQYIHCWVAKCLRPKHGRLD